MIKVKAWIAIPCSKKNSFEHVCHTIKLLREEKTTNNILFYFGLKTQNNLRLGILKEILMYFSDLTKLHYLMTIETKNINCYIQVDHKIRTIKLHCYPLKCTKQSKRFSYINMMFYRETYYLRKHKSTFCIM